MTVDHYLTRTVHWDDMNCIRPRGTGRVGRLPKPSPVDPDDPSLSLRRAVHLHEQFIESLKATQWRIAWMLDSLDGYGTDGEDIGASMRELITALDDVILEAQNGAKLTRFACCKPPLPKPEYKLPPVRALASGLRVVAE